MSNEKNLWAKVSFDMETDTPVRLLQSQADVLSRNTIGLLEGELSAYWEHGVMFHTLYIVAPQLDQYRFALMRIISRFPLYPVYIYDYTVAHEPSVFVNLPGTSPHEIPNASYTARNYADFETAVTEILSSVETANIIRSLMSQSKMLRPDPGGRESEKPRDDSSDNGERGGRKRGNRFNFYDKGLKNGDEIKFVKDKSITAVVCGEREVKFENKRWKLTPLTYELFKRRNELTASGTYQGPLFFTYNGVKLKHLPNKEEGQS